MSICHYDSYVQKIKKFSASRVIFSSDEKCHAICKIELEKNTEKERERERESNRRKNEEEKKRMERKRG